MKTKTFTQYAAKWGNCLAIRIPNNVIKEMGIEPDTPLEVKMSKTPKGDAIQQLLDVFKKLNPGLKKYSDQEILNSFVMEKYTELTGLDVDPKYKEIQEKVSYVLKNLQLKRR